MTELEARHALDLEPEQLVLLFFGQIAPYKGLKYLVEAMPAIADTFPDVRLVIAGKVKRGSDEYWRDIEQALKTIEPSQRVVTRIEHIPDEDIEVYFKAADALVIPYVKIFQSGLPFLAYSFGLPVLATNVGSLAEEISPGENDEICAPCDVKALTAMVTRYARSDLRRDLAKRRADIAANARDRYSWTKVEEITRSAYRDVSGGVGGGPSLTERPGVRSQ